MENDKVGLTVGALAGGLIATGTLASIIPVIGTGMGAVAITTGLSTLGGGSLATGGLGMLGGLSVFGTITTVCSGIGAFAGDTIGSLIDADKIYANYKTRYPTVTRNYVINSPDKLLARYTRFMPLIDSYINIGYNYEIPILIHINEGLPEIGSTIILTPSIIVEKIKHKIVSQCLITDILTIEIDDSKFYEWNRLKIRTIQDQSHIFHVNGHRNIMTILIDFIRTYLMV